MADVDLSVYGRQKTLTDYLQADQTRGLQNQLLGAQTGAELAKGFNLDYMAQQAALRVASGQGSPQDLMVLKAHDAMGTQALKTPLGPEMVTPDTYGALTGRSGGGGAPMNFSSMG